MSEFDAYREEIEKAIRRRYWKVADVDDLVSVAFIRAWRRLEQSDYPDRRRVALQAAFWAAADYMASGLDQLRLARERGGRDRQHRQPGALPSTRIEFGDEETEDDLTPLIERVIDSAPDPAALVIEQISAQAIARRALAVLSDRQREVVRLRYWQGLDNIEIARKLGIKAVTVGVTIHNSLARCRQLLTEENP